MQIAKSQTLALSLIRSDLWQLIVSAVVISIGSNIVSSAISSSLSNSILWQVFMGCLIVCLGLAITYRKLKTTITKNISLKGVMFLDRESKQPLKVAEYDFARDLQSYVSSLNSENKTLGVTWKKEDFWSIEHLETTVKRHLTPSGKLANELLEYFVLKTLSVHVGDYFNKDEYQSSKNIMKLERNDVPEVLLSNRFLETFSRSIEDREGFEHFKTNVSGKTRGVVVSAYGNNGQIYERFELKLPANAKIIRCKDGSIEISTKRFVLTIKCYVEMWGVNLPMEFDRLYVGYKYENLKTVRCAIDLSIKFKAFWVFTPNGWNHYEWLDSFIEKVENKFSFDSFVQRINWATAYTTYLLQSDDHWTKSSNRKLYENKGEIKSKRSPISIERVSE